MSDARAAALRALPHRAPLGAPPDPALAALPLPPGPMPAMLGGRPLKRWRYVAVLAEELMLCAAVVRIGPARQSFWAVWDRERGVLHERTRLRGAPVDVRDPVRARVRDLRDGVRVDVELDPSGAPGVAAVTRHGAQHAWTAKRGGVRARVVVALPGSAERTVEGRAIVDDTAAYYARRTAWRWSAGVGETEDGRAAAWNLVAGVGDPPAGSERTVWLDDEPAEAAVARFDDDLGRVRTDDGGDLRFATEAERERRERLVVVASAYRQPFGTFSGVLPGGVRLARGLGVMEDHVARW